MTLLAAVVTAAQSTGEDKSGTRSEQAPLRIHNVPYDPSPDDPRAAIRITIRDTDEQRTRSPVVVAVAITNRRSGRF
jgi:hypothetical protein